VLGVTALLVVASAVVGLAVGSFLNVVIHRVPRKESVVRPRSRCPHCGVQIGERDNIPVVSWLALRGRCRSCRTPIPLRYPLVEVGTAVLFAAVAVRFGLSAELPVFCVFLGALLALALIDLEHFLLPSRIIYSTLLVEAALLGVTAAVDQRWWTLEEAVLAGLAAFLIFFLIHFIYPAGMAWGDLRLAGLIGFVLGWLGYQYVLVGLFLAFLSASFVGVALIALRRASGKTPIPFGVFLALGALVAVMWGHPLAHAWLPRVA
jgi:leader peptidase (prepilin peptidase)/N-methyltransferase